MYFTGEQMNGDVEMRSTEEALPDAALHDLPGNQQKKYIPLHIFHAWDTQFLGSKQHPFHWHFPFSIYLLYIFWFG